ncbi:MAG: CotH kinase family protein, partial [candidate division KSB1 bacterium]|nr:CotH kinase family protein [candidate division KSB1 bacterium]
VLTFNLGRSMGRYASRTRFCELVLNGRYQGLYVLMEKIKRDKNRVNIAKLDSADVQGIALTGGYIIKIDKTAGENVGGWTSARRQPYQYDYPKPNEIRPEQKAYIKDFIDRFEAAMYADWQVDRSFLDFIDLDSFVDHFILNEFCKNIDAYRISAYLYKDRDDRGGKLTAGPIWDFDLSMAKAFFPQDFGRYEGWQLDYRQSHPTDGYQVPLWWEKLGHSDLFQERAVSRWQELRQGALHIDSLYAEIDRLTAEIAEALPRNFQKYPAMLRGATYEAKLQELKEWIANRLQWIDAHIGSLASAVETGEKPLTFRLEPNYPNPFNPTTTIAFSLAKKSRAVLEIFDLRGRSVEKLIDGNFYPGDYQVTWRADAYPAGVYLYKLSAEGVTLQSKMTLIK